MAVHELILPYPAKTLSPNARADKFTLARAKKAYRTGCWWEARAANLQNLGPGQLRVKLIFHPKPPARRRDLDNAVASMKSGLDGVADLLKIDDSKWKLDAPEWGAPHPRGQVRVILDHTPSAEKTDG